MKKIKLDEYFILLDGYNDEYKITEYDEQLILVSKYKNE